MLFDFDKFKGITERIYPDGGYSLEDALAVFRDYFARYEEFTGKPHPPIKAKQIVNLAYDMPYLELQDRGTSSYVPIDPEQYPDIIDQYFKTPFRNCDYNINHFFSGRIRELRYYELIM